MNESRNHCYKFLIINFQVNFIVIIEAFVSITLFKMDDDITILSDCSDEPNDINKAKKEVHNDLKSDESDFLDDYPEISFAVTSKKNNLKTIDTEEKVLKKSDSLGEKLDNNSSKDENPEEPEWTDADFPELNFEKEYRIKKSVQKEKNSHLLANFKSDNLKTKESESDSDYESQSKPNDYYTQYIEGSKTKKGSIDLSSDEAEELEDEEVQSNKGKEKRKIAKPKKVDEEKKRRLEEQKELRLKKKEEADKEKKRRQMEREEQKLKKQEEAARQKAMKQLNLKNRLITNTDYSLRLMEVILDKEIENSDFFNEYLKAIEETNEQHSVQQQLIPKSITWRRRVEENYTNEKHEVCSKVRIVDENQIMIIWNCEEVVKHVFDDTLISTIMTMKSLATDKKFTLVIYKIEGYFKYSKNVKDQSFRDEILGNETQKKSKVKADKSYSNLPRISRKKFEACLVEIQLLYEINSRLIENPTEMILLIHQYTKSLALLPSKLEKRQESSKVDFFISSDNRDTVKVDKDGNGLRRLWQQQLCQFTLMSLETSEAISSVYKSPLQLIEAYTNCSPAEGEMLLKDIPIRRAAGPLTSVRKIGPELSKKLYIMFTSEDGEIYLKE